MPMMQLIMARDGQEIGNGQPDRLAFTLDECTSVDEAGEVGCGRTGGSQSAPTTGLAFLLLVGHWRCNSFCG